MKSGESAFGFRGAIAPLIPCRGRICLQPRLERMMVPVEGLEPPTY